MKTVQQVLHILIKQIMDNGTMEAQSVLLELFQLCLNKKILLILELLLGKI